MDLDSILATAADMIPDSLYTVLGTASQYLPNSIDLLTSLKFILIFGVGALGVGILARLILGRSSSLNKAVSTAIGMLVIYIVTIAVYTFKPCSLELFLSPLPFAAFFDEYLVIIPFEGTSFNVLCSHILSVVILAFLVNLADILLPDGEHVLSWYLLRFLTIILAMLLHLAANWALKTYLPDFLVNYGPTILLVLIVGMLLLGAAKVILGIVLTAVNPIIGALYTFFFASKIGKQLTKAILSATIICAVFYAMEYFGFTVISISASNLIAYLPMLPAFLILWYLIGHEL